MAVPSSHRAVTLHPPPTRIHRWWRPLVFLVLAAGAPAPWSPVLAQEPGQAWWDEVVARSGPSAGNRLLDWRELLRVSRDRGITRQLETVNRFFNRVHYVEDRAHWGREDYWATPVELLVSNGGDCEDFAIAKYASLKALGVPAASLRLVYAKDRSSGRPHMVLAYYERPESDPLILDNLDDAILPASRRQDLMAIYSFNDEALWIVHASTRSEQVGGSNQSSLWLDLSRRLALAPL